MGKPKKYQEVFYFNRKERLGLLLLSVLIVTTSLLRSYWLTKQQPALSIRWEILPPEQGDSISTAGQIKIELEEFDPNTIQEERLLAFGVPEKAVNNWLRYREKGGQFRSTKDVEKIYSLPATTFRRIQPFLRFPNQEKKLSPRPTLARHKPTINKKELHPFPFDPNQADIEELKQLGLATKTAKQIIRYRESGGTFRKKEDLKKIYSLSQEEYQILEPHIQIEKPGSNRKEKVYSTISINTQRVEDWQQFKGIGPSYAQRIIQYGEKLGGYHHTQQLYEVWGIPDSVIQQHLSYVETKGEITQLSASKASYKTLLRHPYLRSKQVQLITRFREAHKGQISWKDIQALPCFTPEELDRLAPYIQEAQWP